MWIRRTTVHLFGSLPLTHHNCQLTLALHSTHYEIANDFDFTSVLMSLLLLHFSHSFTRVFFLFNLPSDAMMHFINLCGVTRIKLTGTAWEWRESWYNHITPLWPFAMHIIFHKIKSLYELNCSTKLELRWWTFKPWRQID